MIDQPKRGDGEEAWRRYAGDLRQQLGEMNSRLTTAAVAQLEARAVAAEYELVLLRAKWHRSELTLDNLERDLAAGDVERAEGRLRGRRRRIERKAARAHR